MYLSVHEYLKLTQILIKVQEPASDFAKAAVWKRVAVRNSKTQLIASSRGGYSFPTPTGWKELVLQAWLTSS